MWDLAGVQECVCGSTVRGADIERENELPRGTVIRCACHKETTTVQKTARKAKDVVYLPRIRHTFLSGRNPTRVVGLAKRAFANVWVLKERDSLRRPKHFDIVLSSATSPRI